MQPQTLEMHTKAACKRGSGRENFIIKATIKIKVNDLGRTRNVIWDK